MKNKKNDSREQTIKFVSKKYKFEQDVEVRAVKEETEDVVSWTEKKRESDQRLEQP